MSGRLNWKNASIRTKILVPMLILGIVPILSTGLYAINSNNTSRDISEEIVTKDIKDRFSAIMSEKTHEINEFFEFRKKDMQVATHNHFVLEGLEVYLGHTAGNVSHAVGNLNGFFLDVIDHYGLYLRIMVLAPNGTVILHQLSTAAISAGASVNELGKDYSSKSYYKDTWEKEDFDRYTFTDAAASSVGIDAESVMISILIADEHGDEALASLHYSVDLNALFDKTVYYDNKGEKDLAKYNERGLGETGDQYLVQTSTKYLYSPSRFFDGHDGILESKVDTVGVQKAIEQGSYYGIYGDYRGIPILGITWNLGATVSGTDVRNGEDIELRSSFNLPWIYVLEMDVSEVHQSIYAIEDQNNTVFTVLAVILVIASIAIIGIGGYLSRSISKDTVSLSNTMKKAAVGDFTQSTAEKNDLEIIGSSKDEIGILGSSFMSLQSNLVSMIGSTQVTAGLLQSSSEELLTSTEQINASAQEVASTSQAMSNGATSQTELINEINSDIRETSMLIGDIINSIRDNTMQVSQIALQTNILALNAGIEASRAGDYGRGFAVVAENVRKLSDQSKMASESIGAVADEIAVRLENAFGKISNTMLNVVSVSEETAASAEEVAAAAEEMTVSINDITSSVQELNLQAVNSLDLISKYKVNENNEK